MATFVAPKTTVTAQFFNPYAGMGPPACCYCAPTAVATNVTNIVNEAAALAQQQAIHVQVNAYVQETLPGLGGLAFMTKTEDAMRTIERGRIEKGLKDLRFSQGTAEMGMGPFFYPKDTNTQYTP